jgi:hypothetical protein
MGPDSHTDQTKYVGIIVQSSLKGIGIPKLWGTNKLGCNMVDYLDFQATQSSSGGKGGGGSTSYTYKATLVLVICQGGGGSGIVGVRTIYKDSAIYTATSSGSKEVNGSTVTISSKTPEQAAGITQIFNGAIGQAPWSYLETDAPTHAIGYSGMAYAAAYHYPLNESATAPNHNFEVQSAIRATVNGTVIDDANPADIVNDLLPDVPRWPAGAIADLTSYSNYCIAQGLFLSPIADNGRQASDLLTEILTATNSDCFWSGGQLNIVPYGDTAITNNGVTWTPNLTPIYALTWDDIVPNSDGEDPIQWDLKRPADAYNYVQVGFTDRSQQYAEDTATAVDQANINTFGKRQQSPVSLLSICDAGIANTVAQLMVQRSANVRRTCQFYVSELFGLLDPMDLITVPLRNGGARLVRIVEANEQDDGLIEIQAEEMLVGTAHAAQYTRQDALGIPANYAVDPGDSNPPVIINPPMSLTGGQYEVWLGTSGGPNWGGAVVWASFDGDNYQQVGTINQPARYGVTTTDFPAHADPDTTDVLGVNLIASGGSLTSATQADADNQVTLCAVGSEVVAFSTATLTAANTYNLSGYIRRGLQGTTIADQPAGSEFLRLDNTVAVVPYNSAQVGKTIWIKLQSFNVYGNAYEDLDLCTAYEFIAQANGTAVGQVEWTEILGVPDVLSSYVSSGGTANNTNNVGNLSAAQVEALPEDVTAAQTAITANAQNIAQAMLLGAANAAFNQSLATLNGEPVGTVLQQYQTQQNATNQQYAANFTLLGAKTASGTAWAFNGNTVLSDGVTSLATFQNYVENCLGTSPPTIASIESTVSGQTARITLSVNSNGQAVGFSMGTSGVPTSDYFDIISSTFRLIDESSGQTLIPLSYTNGAWTFNANVTINGNLIISGSIGTSAYAVNSISGAAATSGNSNGGSQGGNGSSTPICSITVTTSGGLVDIDGFASMLVASGTAPINSTVILQCDGVTLQSFANYLQKTYFSQTYVGWQHNPGAGQHTYALLDGAGNGVTTAHYGYFLRVQEEKTSR